MKTIPMLILLAGLCAIRFAAHSQETNAIPDTKAAATVATNASGAEATTVPTTAPAPPPGAAPSEQPPSPVVTSQPSPAVQAPDIASAPVANKPSAAVILPNGEVGLRFNFRNAPLDLVLDYMSEAAGFIIVMDARVSGKVDAWSNTPLSKDEAVNLLSTVLHKNGYAAIRNGRTLTIVNKDEAKTRDIPVNSGSDPDDIPKTDVIVTQIMPVRFVEAAQLIKDLQPLVSSTTTMTANEAGNSIVITDTQANIHRVAEIIKAIDIGAQSETEVRVFRLKFADPVEMSELLGNLFPDDSKSGNTQSQVRFGGGGMRGMFGGMGGMPGMPGMGGNTGGSGQSNPRIQKRSRVLAVPDQRTSSVVVSAAKELMDSIAGMVEQLDSNPAKKQKVYVYSLENADVTEVEQVLSDMFERNSTSTSRNSRSGTTQNNALQNRSTQNMQQNRSSSMNNSAFGSSSRGGGSSGGF